MLFSQTLLVAFTTFLTLCFIPNSTNSLPLDDTLILDTSDSSHNEDYILIDPIYQAEYGDEELESKKMVAKSIFDMVLRAPPPSTNSKTRCPPGTQSPYEGGPCTKKSTDSVALVDKSFLVDTLRGLTKEGVLLASGSNRTRRTGNRKRPMFRAKLPSTSAPSTTTVRTTTKQPITTIRTEIPLETITMRKRLNPTLASRFPSMG